MSETDNSSAYGLGARMLFLGFRVLGFRV